MVITHGDELKEKNGKGESNWKLELSKSYIHIESKWKQDEIHINQIIIQKLTIYTIVHRDNSQMHPLLKNPTYPAKLKQYTNMTKIKIINIEKEVEGMQ